MLLGFTTAQCRALHAIGFTVNEDATAAEYRYHGFFQHIQIDSLSDRFDYTLIDSSEEYPIEEYYDNWQVLYKEIIIDRNNYDIPHPKLATSPVKAKHKSRWRVIDRKAPGPLDVAFRMPGFPMAYWVELTDGRLISVFHWEKAVEMQELVRQPDFDVRSLDPVLYTPTSKEDKFFCTDGETYTWNSQYILDNY